MLDSRLAFTSAVVSFTFAEDLERFLLDTKTMAIMAGRATRTISASSQRILSIITKAPIRFSMAMEKSSGP